MNFIHSGASDDEMTVGLNAIAAMCRRCPSALLEGDDGPALLHELLSLTRARQVAHAHEKR